MVRNGGATRPGSSPSPAEPSAILIRTPNWLGDLLISTAFVRAVLERFPTARVDLIVRQGFEVLPLPQRGIVFPFDRTVVSAGAFGARFRDQGYSHCFVLPPSFSSAWMAWRTGIPQRIGYRGEGRAWLLRPSRRHRHVPRSVHLVQEYLDLLRPWLNATPEAFPPGLELSTGWVDANRPVAAPVPGSYVVLAPGAEYGPAKMWPEAHYRALATALDTAGWPVRVVGLATERSLGAALVAGTRAGSSLCGATTLPELVALLAGARLLVSNDSGAMHLGAALGLPQLALFGSTNPTWTGPLNPRAEVLYRAEPCSPCYARTCRLGHLRCLQELRPEQVVERALALLAQ